MVWRPLLICSFMKAFLGPLEGQNWDATDSLRSYFPVDFGDLPVVFFKDVVEVVANAPVASRWAMPSRSQIHTMTCQLWLANISAASRNILLSPKGRFP